MTDIWGASCPWSDHYVLCLNLPYYATIMFFAFTFKIIPANLMHPYFYGIDTFINRVTFQKYVEGAKPRILGKQQISKHSMLILGDLGHAPQEKFKT